MILQEKSQIDYETRAIHLVRLVLKTKKHLYYLGRYKDKELFLSENRLCVVGIKMDGEKPYITSLYIGTVNNNGINDYTIKIDDNSFSEADFLDILNLPAIYNKTNTNLFGIVDKIQKLEKESENKDVRNRSFSCTKTNDNTNILAVKSHMTICMNKKRRYQITVTLNNTKYVYTTVQQGLFRHTFEKLFKRKPLNISYGIDKSEADSKCSQVKNDI